MPNALDNIAKQFDTEMVMPLQQVLIGRKLIPVNQKLSYAGLGMQSVDYWTYREMAGAIINYEIQEHNEDAVDVSSSTIQIPVIKEDYKIPRRTYESFRSKGIDIDSGVAIDAAYQVALLEDTLILDGWKPDNTNYAIKGLYPWANNAEASALDFGTYGNVIKKVGKAIALLEADKVYGPYNLVMNPTQANELLSSISTAGFPEQDVVMKMLNKNGNNGQIFSTPIQTVDTGMLLAASNPIYYDLIVAQDAKNTLGEDSKQPVVSPIYGSVFEALVPRIKKIDAICKLTGI